MTANISIKNKKARFNYEITETYITGIQLVGTEIKSLRQGKAGIEESFCFLKDGEVWIKNMMIAEYDFGNINNHHPTRDRKLLLKKGEIQRIEKKLQDQGVSLIALKVFINERGLAKLEIGIGKGKKLYDKRNSLKDKAVKRDLDRLKKNF